MITKEEPQGELMIRTLAMPAETNPSGDIFGGWLVSQMDLASSGLAHRVAHSRVVTVAIETMAFLFPVKVGDFVSCYANLLQVGNTSMKIQVQAWAQKRTSGEMRKVTEGIFTFVAVNEKGKPIPVPKQ